MIKIGSYTIDNGYFINKNDERYQSVRNTMADTSVNSHSGGTLALQNL